MKLSPLISPIAYFFGSGADPSVRKFENSCRVVQIRWIFPPKVEHQHPSREHLYFYQIHTLNRCNGEHIQTRMPLGQAARLDYPSLMPFRIVSLGERFVSVSNVVRLVTVNGKSGMAANPPHYPYITFQPKT